MNNINTQSHFLRRRYEKLTYFRRGLVVESEIHVSTPQYFMPTFLLKFVGGTPQNTGLPTPKNEFPYSDTELLENSLLFAQISLLLTWFHILPDFQYIVGSGT